MENIWDVYTAIKSLIADKVRNSAPSANNISYALTMGQLAAIAYYKPLKEAGDDLAATALASLVKNINDVSSSTGLLTYPADWYDTELITETVNGEMVSYSTILDTELYEAKRSVLYPIADSPRYMEVKTGIQLYPETTHLVNLKYLAKPQAPKIGYTVSGNTEVYDPLTSVQLALNPAYYPKIIQLSLPYIGVNLSDAEITSLYNLAKQ